MMRKLGIEPGSLGSQDGLPTELPLSHLKMAVIIMYA